MWSAGAALPAPLERETLPGEVRPWGHRRGFDAVDEIRTAVGEIYAALRKRTELAHAGGDLNALGTARPAESRLDRHCADSRDFEQVGQCPVVGLLELHGRFHPGGVGSETDLVVASTIGAMRGHGGDRIRHRTHMRRASDEEPRAHARQLGSELQHLDRDLVDIDMWHARTTTLLGR